MGEKHAQIRYSRRFMRARRPGCPAHLPVRPWSSWYMPLAAASPAASASAPVHLIESVIRGERSYWAPGNLIDF
jgi:hypothetical protein